MTKTHATYCPHCGGELAIVEAVPQPAPVSVYRITGSERALDQVMGVCVPCDLLVVGVREMLAADRTEARELEEAQSRAHAARLAFQGGDARGAMRDRAQAFPVLRQAAPPGLEPWDPAELDTWLACGAASDATLDAVAFVLAVWNTEGGSFVGDDGRLEENSGWSRPFDAMAALARWDKVNRAVFVNWAGAPWWP